MTERGNLVAAISWLVRVVFRILYRVEVCGQIEDHDRTLIVANHQSFLDAVMLGAFLPVWPMYLVHTTIAERWYFKLGLRLVPHVVTDTSKPMAMKTLLALVESGQPAMIFPEGRITSTASLMKIYDGPAFVAARSGCSVVPIHVEGAVHSPFARSGSNAARKWFPKIRITIQPAVTIPMPEGRKARERRRKASEQLRRVLQLAAYESRRSRTLTDAFLDSAALNGFGKPVLEDINRNFRPATYREILKGALALGRLVSRISAPNETVGLLMPNANATVALLLGTIGRGRIAAMLNYTAGPLGLAGACRVARIKTVLTSRAFIEKAGLDATVGALADVEVLYLEDLRSRITAQDKLWILWSLWNPRRAFHPGCAGDPAVVMFTSGSEGAPKGVVLSHESILANVAQIDAAFPLNSSDKFLTALPLFHAFGITAGVMYPLLKGCPVVLYPSPLHYRNVPEFVYDHDCTVLFTTNTFLSKYAQAAHPYDFQSLRFLVVGAEKLSDDVRALCHDKFGIRALEGYGATECSPVLAVNTPLAYRKGSVGELLPGIEYRLQTVDELEYGGILHVRGGNVMLGYLREDRPGEIQPTSSEFGPGWYNTGDVVSVDDGFVTIQARLKRFAKVAGEMVSLELVEQIAAGARPGALHAAVGYKDPVRGESIVLFTTAAGLTREELRASVRRLGASELALPRHIVHPETIPVLGNGKKDYVSLTALAALPAEPAKRWG